MDLSECPLAQLSQYLIVGNSRAAAEAAAGARMLDCESARRDTIAIALRANVDWGRHVKDRESGREPEYVGAGPNDTQSMWEWFRGSTSR